MQQLDAKLISFSDHVIWRSTQALSNGSLTLSECEQRFPAFAGNLRTAAIETALAGIAHRPRPAA